VLVQRLQVLLVDQMFFFFFFFLNVCQALEDSSYVHQGRRVHIDVVFLVCAQRLQCQKVLVLAVILHDHGIVPFLFELLCFLCLIADLARSSINIKITTTSAVPFQTAQQCWRPCRSEGRRLPSGCMPGDTLALLCHSLPWSTPDLPSRTRRKQCAK